MIVLWQSFTAAAPDLLRTMARHEVQTTIFILVLLVADSLLKQPSPRFRYALWLVALAKALWPPFLSLPALDFTSRQSVTETLAPLAPVIQAPVFQASVTEAPLIQAPLMEVPATQTSVSVVPLTEASAPVLTWGAVFLGVWVVVALAVVTLMIVNYIRFRLRLRPPHVERYQFEEPESVAGRPWPPVWATDRIHSPLTMGLLHPRIYLTWKVIASGARELRAILYHELAHILRRDGWITLLQAVALIIHPFNPLVWLMNTRLSRYREQLCDDFALRHTGVTPKAYGNMLLDQLSQTRVPLLAVHTPTYFFETRRDLIHRLTAIAKRKAGAMQSITSPQKIILGGLLFGLLMITSQCAEQAVATSVSDTETADRDIEPATVEVIPENAEQVVAISPLPETSAADRDIEPEALELAPEIAEQAVITSPVPATSAADMDIEPEPVEFLPGDQVYQLRPARQITQIAGLKTFPTIHSIQHEGTDYFLHDQENYRWLQLGADFELLDEFGRIRKGLFKRNDPFPYAVGMKDDSLYVCYRERYSGGEFHVFHNGELIRSFAAPFLGDQIDRMVLADDVIIFGTRIAYGGPIRLGGYDGTLPLGHPDRFGGEWLGELDYNRSPVEVFSDSRGDIIAVLKEQPLVQKYSSDYELIETYDLRSFEFIETMWDDRRILLDDNSLYEDRLYILTSRPGGNNRGIYSVAMLDINPDGMTPVGTLELAGFPEDEYFAVGALCAGPDNQLLVYNVPTRSLLIYEIPLQESSSLSGAAVPPTPDTEIQRAQAPDNSLINLRSEYEAALARMRGTENIVAQPSDTIPESTDINSLRAEYEAALARMRAMEDSAAAGTPAIQEP